VKWVFRRRLATRLAHVEAHLTRNDYLLGQTFSVADVYLFVVSNWACSANVDLSSYLHVLTLRRRVGARPPVQAAMKVEGLT
jgi:glutathione S-transferase